MDQRVQRLGYVGALTVAIIAAALLSHHLAILLALGPTAYFLALLPTDGEITAKDVLVSHLAAVVSGWIAYLLLTQGVDPMAVAPRSIESLRVVASMLLAMGLTAVVLFRFEANIATAHVTTTVVALGALTSPFALGALVLCVGVVAGLHTVFHETDGRSGRVTA